MLYLDSYISWVLIFPTLSQTGLKLPPTASESALKHHFRYSSVLRETKSINAFTINNSKQMPYGLTVAVWLHITSLALALNTLINKGVKLPPLWNFHQVPATQAGVGATPEVNKIKIDPPKTV